MVRYESLAISALQLGRTLPPSCEPLRVVSSVGCSFCAAAVFDTQMARNKALLGGVFLCNYPDTWQDDHAVDIHFIQATQNEHRGLGDLSWQPKLFWPLIPRY